MGVWRTSILVGKTGGSQVTKQRDDFTHDKDDRECDGLRAVLSRTDTTQATCVILNLNVLIAMLGKRELISIMSFI